MSAAAQTSTKDVGTLPSLSIQGSRATLHLNRPRVMNRVQPEDVREILRLLTEVEANPAVRVLVIASTGKAFSAGYHLGDLAQQANAGGGDPSTDNFETLVDRVEQVTVPTIARLHGGVYGGSTDLALACDFRVGVTPHTVMFMPAARIGVHYYESGLKRYVSRLGLNNAKRLFMLAEQQSAEELLRIGYLTDLVADEAELDARIDAIARRLGELAPLAVQGAKRAINEIAHQALDRDALKARIAVAKNSDDLKEGLAAFREKRKPVFKGR
jgi:enoyl-CoA hydratase